ncbi:SDR family oxidoreductase [Streptomyces sp. NPDC050625]|uniref:SDR family NAD(P)-dependent oxidoreductase n=1 Tax=Streptomyces sp. NPDC050625 TaxID=3154629 RepID=UPI00342872BB
MDSQRHAGKTAIVTGAASGIGLATVIRLAAEGAHVIGCNRSAEARERAAGVLEELGLSARFVDADVTDQSSVDALVAMADGRVDLLANVAGAMDGYATVADVSDEVWHRVIDVNMTGVMRLCRAVVPVMQAQGSGSIVTVASRGAQFAGPAGVAYVASKHGVLGLARSIAWYFGPEGIRSNVVLPGAVHSEMHKSSQRSGWAFERAAIAKGPMPDRKADADEIAAAISWLGSDEASYVNGATLNIDAGWSVA